LSKATFQIGAIIGDQYRLEEFLGSGAWAEVYRAFCTKREIFVAIKILTIISGTKSPKKAEEYRTRFLREIKTALKINHPSVISVYDFCVDNNSCYYVMEYIAGAKTLHDELSASAEHLPLDLIYCYFKCIVEGVRAMHAAGAIHRDLKAPNILVFDSPEGPRAKILDLGVVSIAGSTETVTGMPLCTPKCVAPEYIDRIFDSRKPYDHRIDQFALGALLYETLTKHPPFDALEMDEVFEQVRQHFPPCPSKLRPDLPICWDHFTMRLLAKSPDERYPDDTALHTAFLALSKPDELIFATPKQHQDISESTQKNFGRLPNSPIDNPKIDLPPLRGAAAQFAADINIASKPREQPNKLPMRYRLSLVAAGILVVLLLLTGASFLVRVSNKKKLPIQIDDRIAQPQQPPLVTPKELTLDAAQAKPYQLVQPSTTDKQPKEEPQKPEPSKTPNEKSTRAHPIQKKIESATAVAKTTEVPGISDTFIIKHYGTTTSQETNANDKVQAFIAMGTSVPAKLLTPLQEGTLDPSVTVEILAPVKTTDPNVTIPAGTKISGTVEFQRRAHSATIYMKFSKLIWANTNETTIAAVAAMKNGRIGLPAEVEGPESNFVANVGEAVADAAQVGASMLPGAQATGRFVDDGRNKARSQRNEEQIPIDLPKNTKLWVLFKQKVAL
jgi:eukaryotic-like serine/threonine-protein kinase